MILFKTVLIDDKKQVLDGKCKGQVKGKGQDKKDPIGLANSG